MTSLAFAEASDLSRAREHLPEKLQGTWSTTAFDREGVAQLTITLDIGTSDIRWAIECQLPNGKRDTDSVTTPVRLRDGYLEVTRRAGSFETNARPCELGIREKFLSWHLDNDDQLRLADFTGKVRTFRRMGSSGTTSKVFAGKDALPCTVQPALVDLRFGERALFRVTAKGFTSPTVQSDMRYVGDPSGGLRIASDSLPVKRNLDAVEVTDGVVRLIRSYDAKEAVFGNQEQRYVARYPGGIVETVELRQGGLRAVCTYRVRLIPNSPAAPGNLSALR